MMDSEKKSRILHQITSNDFLPSLSPLTIQLIEAASDERTSVLDLNRIIEQDPGLTTRLLKMVNSAYFGRRTKISSISHAIIMAGFKRVRLMALNISLRDTFPLGRVGGMDYDLFWKTSLYRALIAQGFSQAEPSGRSVGPGRDLHCRFNTGNRDAVVIPHLPAGAEGSPSPAGPPP